ncbi:hypothetical protein AB7378_22250 [Providencia rettgeri]
MATESTITQLNKTIETCSAYMKDELLQNPEWGSLNFKDVESEIANILQIATHLKTLPIELIPTDKIVTEINTSFTQSIELFEKIKSFSIEQANPSAVRTQLSTDVKNKYDNLFNSTFTIIPYLAYQRGDVERNIKVMVDKVDQTAKETENILEKAQKSQSEIDGIVTAAREAAISAGVGSFTTDFSEEANSHKTNAKKWLVVTIVLASLTLLISLVLGGMSLYMDYSSDKNAQIMASKITIIIIMLTATLWSSKLYKTAIHLSVTNKHKANALKTFLAFSQASDDPQTKNAVLIEASHCIFSNVNTGLAGTTDSNESVKYLEVFKNINSK